MKKRLISILLAFVVVLTSLGLSVSAFASSHELILNVKRQATIEGAYDLEWFYYTPDHSGKYSLLSYNVPWTQAYLFVTENDPETNGRKMVNLAYSNSDPYYEQNGHNNKQFCLTYHLEAGVTYQFAVGWYMPEFRTEGTMTVMLRCDSYDDSAIDRVEIVCPIALDAYVEGSWDRDNNGEYYFRYSISKVVANSTVYLYYSDGTVSSVTGKENIDGYNISYIDNQYYSHWYPASDPRYTSNSFGVKVLDKSAECSVTIKSSALYEVRGKVVNTLGEPISGANIYSGKSKVCTTNADGTFIFPTISGQTVLRISTNTSIDREISVVITTNAGQNDFSANPFVVCNCDYVRDGYVNAKDFAYITRNNINAKEEYKASINFTSASYDTM